ncbi:MAG: acyl-ACP--UDP-N-acetylglucosamine O-acyltransferase [Candidatus Caenarcaniphilales bacterium]|nr:acyl-ACP--UDP-N-acetylglucosamine O-acyltransferase [Candidatus Caenarcaniphilales bacterium]
MAIHSMAIVSPKAEIHKDAEIGPYCIIGESVLIGERSSIGAHTVIDGHTQIGSNCKIYPHVSIGLPPQDLTYKGENTQTIIGNNVTLREFCSVHKATTKGDGKTEIGNNCYLMNYVHVGHDCKLQNDIIIANSTNLGGHVQIGERVTMGGGCMVHQHVVIGDFVMAAGLSGIQKSVPPFVLVGGLPAKIARMNSVGLKRIGLESSEIKIIEEVYRLIKNSGVSAALKEFEPKAAEFPHLMKLINFYKNSNKGVTGFMTRGRNESDSNS